MGWKKLIFGEKMPDKDDPKYKDRYEKEVETGKKFARDVYKRQVAQLNNSNDGFNYYMDYWRSSYIITTNGKQSKKAYAYSITVTKSWNYVEEAYEEYFDSYSMDLNTFRAQMNVKLAELNDNEDGYTYYIGTDAKNRCV